MIESAFSKRILRIAAISEFWLPVSSARSHGLMCKWSHGILLKKNLCSTAAALLGTKQSNTLRKRSDKAYHELRVSLNEGIGRAAKSVVGRS